MFFKKSKRLTNGNHSAQENRISETPSPNEDRYFETKCIDENDPMPSPDEVERLMNEWIDDFDISQKVPLMSMPTSRKWDFLIKQNLIDRQRLSPQWLLKQLRENFSIDVLKKIDSYLSQFRISWGKQFCQINGHLEILILLACKQARIDFGLSEEDDLKVIEGAIQCIRSICNTKAISKCITSNNKSLFTIINSTCSDPKIVGNILEILIRFIFENDNDQHQFETTQKIFKYLHELDKEGKNGWEVISMALKNQLTHTFLNILTSFLKALLLVLCKSPSLFIEWYQEIEKTELLKLLDSFKENKSEISKTLDFIKTLKNVQEYGIETNNESSITMKQNERGEIDDLMNQLQKDDFLTLKDPYFDLSRLKKKKILGKGGFGEVYLAISKETSDKYAVKISKIKMNEDEKFADINLYLFREINLMGSFDHPAIIKFIGYSPTDFKGFFFPTIIMEYYVNKSLYDIIILERKGCPPKGWDETRKLINVYGIASGMKYLHMKGIMHRDLKTLNILMDDLLCPKISDFGLSKLTESSENESMNMQSSNHQNGTPSICAPEFYSDENYSNKVDVYAFAFILYELFIGKNPFESLSGLQIMRKVTAGERPNIPDNAPSHYKDLIQKCWAHDPDDRPTFESIINELISDRSYITESINESTYRDYVDYLDNYQNSLDVYKHISFDDFITGKHGNSTLEKVNISDSE